MATSPSPDSPGLQVPSAESAASAGHPWSTDEQVSELHALLLELQKVAAAKITLAPVFSDETDNELIQVRLGIASSLFAALQCKHAATAGHALRVTLTCSAWALRMNLPTSQRDVIEVAALLHDVGVIGVPDHILLKCGPLDADEAAIVTRSRRMSLEILRRACSAPEILEIVEHVPAWYDGTREGCPRRGDDIPLGARMIAIAEAHDAMTTDHVYRAAMSHERAMTELFDCAAKQFDPQLVRQYAELRRGDPAAMHHEVAQRWLKTLDTGRANSFWELRATPAEAVPSHVDALFEARLLDNMYDAVVFVNCGRQVTLWNRAAERLTGISGSSVCQRQWHPALLHMGDEKGHPVVEADCPVHSAIRSGVQSLRRLTICGRTGRTIAVDTHTIPVMEENGTTSGAILMFHDASSETSLEQRCQNLYEKATKDPLTQVANRAEFNRVHEMFVAAHRQQQVPCSLMICDLDRFKQVNDTFGHQAGDEVIKSLASLLKASCRPGDLVARYGGEEFVVLYADCDNATAVERAEQVRHRLNQMPQPKMEGRQVTISAGVTEIQPGDTPETMLRRADRALLMAKDNGRNVVVQLGTGSSPENDKRPQGRGGFWPRKRKKPGRLLEQHLTTPVPLKMAIEKLRGFVADHQAKITEIDGSHLRLEIDDNHPSRLRRLTDRPVTFLIDLRFREQRPGGLDGAPVAGNSRTQVHLSISPTRNRDRRRSDVDERARQVLVSFRSYLMASEDEAPAARDESPSRAPRTFASWWGRK